jgi:Leucine carboxyl methyltransferase
VDGGHALPGTGDNPTIGPRTWFLDQLVIRAAGDGFGQVVLLAAGLDTRAFRLPLPAQAVVYELDEQAVLTDKQAILDREHALPRCARRPVAADLAGAEWPASLAAAGFDHGAPAVFVAEGLTWYLANPAAAPYFELAAARGARWQFGTNDPGGFLAAHGWRADIHDMYAVARSLGRWSPPDVPDDIADRAAAASPNWFITATRSS